MSTQFSPTLAMRRMMAESLLPIMNDSKTWDTPPPKCVDGEHDWQIMEDYKYSYWLPPYMLAIVCPKCTLSLGF